MNRLLKGLLAGAAICAIPSYGFAQTTEEEQAAAANAQATEVGEVVVTAQRRAERLQDVPIAISTATAEEVEAMGITQTTDLTRITPGLVFTHNGNVAQPAIRGVSTKNSSPGDSPNVALYVDGVYISSQYSGFMDFNNIERIEVLKGPQGTLYGRNATGGAIIVVTKTPQDSFYAEGEIGYGSFNQVRGQLYLTGPLAWGITADFAAMYDRDDGWIEDILTGEKLWTKDNYGFRTKFKIEPTEALTLTLAADYSRHSTATGYAIVPLNGNTSAVRTVGAVFGRERGDVALSFVPYAKNMNKGASLTAEYDAGPFTVTSVTGARENKNSSLTDNDMSNINSAFLRFGGPTRTYTEELVATSNGDGPLQWLVGAFYIFDKAQRKFNIVNSGQTTKATQWTEAFAPYFELSYAFNDHISLIGGLRYNWEERRLLNAQRGIVRVDNVSHKWERTTYRLTGQYTVDPELNFYLTNSTGFKSGVYNTTATVQEPVDPEYIEAWQLGAKSTKGGIGLSAELFHYDYTNLQVLRSLDPLTGSSSLANAASAKVKGIEVSSFGRLTDNLRYTAGIAYLDAKYESFPLAEVLDPLTPAQCEALNAAPNFPPWPCGNRSTQRDVSGNQLIRAPEWSANASLMYERDLWGGIFDATGSIYYTSDFAHDVDNRIMQPSYTLLRAEAGWAPISESWRVSVWGDNLTDEEYFLNVNTSTTGDTSIYAAPRRFGVTLSFKTN